ncbi:NUDIX domain-containing protein [Ferroacidibacillus organovorans]|uniref:NUDIX domain-containing protein n=1 Tax=Ferroacidibacillus organovorans TaxID=1765683 RepID=UPI0015C43C5B|nr:NUDIX domain-containing protein [Ferroacidibacillus organovorans]
MLVLATRFRHIARAVIVKEGKILIAMMKGAHSFLPGGGVELGEGAKSALQRELKEELGIESCSVGRFLGAIEVFIEEIPNEAYLHEACHLFEVHVDSLTPSSKPESRESHLEFYWMEFNEENLVSHDVLPKVIQKTLPSLYRGKIQWISSFEV